MVLQFQQTNPLVAADPPSCNLQKSMVSSRWEPHPSNWFFSLFRTCQPRCSSGESGRVTTKGASSGSCGSFLRFFAPQTFRQQSWVLSSEAAGGPAHSKNQNQWRVRHGVVSVIGSDLDAVGFVTQNFTHPNAVYHCFFCQRSESPRVCGVNKNPRAGKKKTTTIPICIIAVSHPKVYESHIIFFLKTPKFGRFQELGTSKKLRFLSLPARSREADRMASVTPERAAGVGSQ